MTSLSKNLLIQEQGEVYTIELQKFNTNKNLVNIFTKPLERNQFHLIATNIMTYTS